MDGIRDLLRLNFYMFLICVVFWYNIVFCVVFWWVDVWSVMVNIFIMFGLKVISIGCSRIIWKIC